MKVSQKYRIDVLHITGIPRYSRYSIFAISIFRDRTFLYLTSIFAILFSIFRDFLLFSIIFFALSEPLLLYNWFFAYEKLMETIFAIIYFNQHIFVVVRLMKLCSKVPVSNLYYIIRYSRFFDIRDGLRRRINREYRGIPVHESWIKWIMD